MSDITIDFDGKTYALDDFSLGDLEWLEEFLGGNLNDEGVMNSMKAAVGFVYVIKRQDDPAFTIDQARQLKLSVLEGPPPETAAGSAKARAGKRPPKRAAR